MAVTQHTINDLPVSLNTNVGDAQKILQALGQLPHNMVRNLIDDLTAQIQHQIQQHVAASQAMHQPSQQEPSSGTPVASANGNSPATPATSPSVE